MEILILRIQNNNLEFQFQMSNQITFLNLNLRTQNINILFWIRKNNLEFKYQFWDQISLLI
jgi:hypothetical protein